MIFRTFSAFQLVVNNLGRRASLCSALAAGCHISRRWRGLKEAVVSLDRPLEKHVFYSRARADVVNDQIVIVGV